MKISLFVVGKTVHSYINPGIEEYSKRISHYCPFNIQFISDARNAKSLTQEQQKIAEGQNILSQIEKADYEVLLDERGKEFKSLEFSAYIEKKMQTVQKRLIFIIGGPYGFSKDVYDRANAVSYTHLTLPTIRLV